MLSRIDHIGVAVADLDAAKDLYTRTFGMTCVHEETNEDQGVHEAMMAVGASGSCVQLLVPLSEGSTIATFLERHGPGVHHIAYTVDDLDAETERLRAAGDRMLYDQPRRGTSGSRINFVHPKDAGGVLVELVEHPTDRSGS